MLTPVGPALADPPKPGSADDLARQGGLAAGAASVRGMQTTPGPNRYNPPGGTRLTSPVGQVSLAAAGGVLNAVGQAMLPADAGWTTRSAVAAGACAVCSAPLGVPTAVASGVFGGSMQAVGAASNWIAPGNTGADLVVRTVVNTTGGAAVGGIWVFAGAALGLVEAPVLIPTMITVGIVAGVSTLVSAIPSPFSSSTPDPAPPQHQVSAPPPSPQPLPDPIRSPEPYVSPQDPVMARGGDDPPPVTAPPTPTPRVVTVPAPGGDYSDPPPAPVVIMTPPIWVPPGPEPGVILIPGGWQSGHPPSGGSGMGGPGGHSHDPVTGADMPHSKKPGGAVAPKPIPTAVPRALTPTSLHSRVVPAGAAGAGTASSATGLQSRTVPVGAMQSPTGLGAPRPLGAGSAGGAGASSGTTLQPRGVASAPTGASAVTTAPAGGNAARSAPAARMPRTTAPAAARRAAVTSQPAVQRTQAVRPAMQRTQAVRPAMQRQQVARPVMQRQQIMHRPAPVVRQAPAFRPAPMPRGRR
jgi:hypothetical protein